MITRALSLILDTSLAIDAIECFEGVEDQHNGFIFTLNDIIMLIFYFVELIPSIIIILVVWKSNVELRYKKIVQDHHQKSIDPLIESKDEDQIKSISDSRILANKSGMNSDSSRFASE